MNIQQVINKLPILEQYGVDINGWLNDFNRIMELYDINKPERKFTFLKECVEFELREELILLKEKNNVIPQLEEIKCVIENYLKYEDMDKKELLVVMISQNIENFINKKIIEIEGRKYYKQNGRLRKIIEDEKEKYRLVEAAHIVGHEGIYKTYHRLKPNYYWKGMNRDINLYIKYCPKCQMYKRQKQNENVENIPTKPGYPFSRVGLDLVGPLPRTKTGNKFIIILMDYLTKWIEAVKIFKIKFKIKFVL